MAEWARFLDATGDSLGSFYNWGKGHRPKGGVQELAEVYELLRSVGGDPHALAVWVFTGRGEMPRPEGANVPNVSAPAPASPVTVEARETFPIDLERAMRKALEENRRTGSAEAGMKVIEWALETVDSMRATLRQAKQRGLASFTLLVGGAALAFASSGSGGSRHNAKLIREEIAEWARRELERQEKRGRRGASSVPMLRKVGS